MSELWHPERLRVAIGPAGEIRKVWAIDRYRKLVYLVPHGRFGNAVHAVTATVSDLAAWPR